MNRDNEGTFLLRMMESGGGSEEKGGLAISRRDGVRWKEKQDCL